MLDLQAARAASLRDVKAYGLPANPSLPLLDATLELRSLGEIASRAEVLAAVVASAYGFSKAAALAWLRSNHLHERLTPNERQFLEGRAEHTELWLAEVECLNAFAWLLGHMQALPLNAPPRPNLVRVFPDLKRQESPDRFVAACRLRTREDALSSLDLYYCADWGCRELSLARRHTALDCTAIRHRRWALEWALGSEEWDAVSLDT